MDAPRVEAPRVEDRTVLPDIPVAEHEQLNRKIIEQGREIDYPSR